MMRWRHLILGGLLLCGAAWWILGDAFIPWTRSAAHAARKQLLKVVDQYQLDLERVTADYQKAKEKVGELRAHRGQIAARLHSLERAKQVTEGELTAAKESLAALEQALHRGQRVVLVSGREPTPQELKLIATRKANAMKLANQKIAWLGELQGHCKAALLRLDKDTEQAPLKLGELEVSIEDLRQKIAFYQDMARWMEDDNNVPADWRTLVADAQKRLEEAHARVDAKLLAFRSIHDMEIELGPAKQEAEIDQVLRAVRDALRDGGECIARN